MHPRVQKILSKLLPLPQRYVLALMGFFAIVNAYTMRICISVAITEMVRPINSSNVGDKEMQAKCGSEVLNDARTSMQPDRLYDWTEQQQGLILSSFYWGYVLTHLPGGLIAERFGGKYLLGLGILCTALFTLLTPLVVLATNGNWIYVVAVRVVEGLGEGTTFPAINVLLAHWTPAAERSKIGSIVFAGSQIGTIVGYSMSGALISWNNDWAPVFYFFGLMGIVWFLLWTLLCYSTPSCHPYISSTEKAYLEENVENVSSTNALNVPWHAILTSAPVWALVIAQVGHDWGYFAMITDLPKFMKDILGFNIKENGLWSSLPYAVMWLVSLSAGCWCDWLIHKRGISVTWARKIFTTVASMGPAVFLLVAAYISSDCTDRYVTVLMFTIGMGLMGFFYSGMKVNALDLSPNFAGTLMAIVNGLGALAGIIVPYLIGVMTQQHTAVQWRNVFWLTFVVLAVTNVLYLWLGSGKVQPWNAGSNVGARNRVAVNDNKESSKTHESIAYLETP